MATESTSSNPEVQVQATPSNLPPTSIPPQSAAQKLRERRSMLKNQRTGIQRREQIKKCKEAQTKTTEVTAKTRKNRTSKDIAKSMAKETIKKILEHFQINDEKMEQAIWREVMNQSVKTEQDIFNSILRKLKLQMAEKMSRPSKTPLHSEQKVVMKEDNDVENVISFSPEQLSTTSHVPGESRKSLKRPSEQLVSVQNK
jgi:capsular polysaccharide biosynthesis protein